MGEQPPGQACQGRTPIFFARGKDLETGAAYLLRGVGQHGPEFVTNKGAGMWGKTRAGARGKRARALAALIAVAAGLVALSALVSQAATVVPSIDPLVKVVTRSGSVTKTSFVPVGGVPTPIDVDGGVPDIDVSIGLVAADELPGRPVVPNIVVARNQVAVRSGAPAPTLDLDATLIIRNLAKAGAKLAEVTYGYETPPGGRVPPKVTAKLIGPLESGFVDPMVAKLEAPGYSGPLKVDVRAKTDTFDGTFATTFDPMPEITTVVADPTADGVDLHYDRGGPFEDVELLARVDLLDPKTNGKRVITADIERLPTAIDVEYHNTVATAEKPAGLMTVDYTSTSLLAKADVEATYQETDGNGNVTTDAVVRAAGLPGALAGSMDTVFVPTADPNDDPKLGGPVFKKAQFSALDGEVDAVDFEARNYVGDSQGVPEPALTPGQLLAISTKTYGGGRKRWRAAGRILGVRAASLERRGALRDGLDLRTDIGNGNRPLRAIFDSGRPVARGHGQRREQAPPRRQHCQPAASDDPHDFRALAGVRGRAGLRRRRRADADQDLLRVAGGGSGEGGRCDRRRAIRRVRRALRHLLVRRGRGSVACEDRSGPSRSRRHGSVGVPQRCLRCQAERTSDDRPHGRGRHEAHVGQRGSPRGPQRGLRPPRQRW